ncbi:MAG TPA: ATP synthase F0 subunit A, partial [Candidatus Moranbacteria bacterium]|nr:ATP synthase F0 subunit A [Candidatus Moranbacteria bacterium]
MDISLTPELIFKIGNFPITNTFLMTISVSIFLIIMAWLVKRKVSLIPHGLQNVAETVLEALLNLVNGVTQDREQTKKFFPLVATIFIFVIF